MPKFSIVLATRDRPALFYQALESVLRQDFDDFEVIIVNDGSTEENEKAYKAALESAASAFDVPISTHWLTRRPKGHGQSYSLNFGVDHSNGEYVGFLDDDDEWVDSAHLSRAAAALASASKSVGPADLFMTNQKAYRSTSDDGELLWIGKLEGLLTAQGTSPDETGTYQVQVDDLLGADGFAHVNCLIVRRALYLDIGGMDEGIRWECDRDLFLRLIDKAGTMLHHPAVVSRHNVPDPSKSTNMTTALGMIEKRLLQVRVLDKAALFSTHESIRKNGRQHKAYALKKIAEELSEIGDWTTASYYATEALGAAPNPKWAAFTARLFFRRLFSSQQSQSH